MKRNHLTYLLVFCAVIFSRNSYAGINPDEIKAYNIQMLESVFSKGAGREALQEIVHLIPEQADEEFFEYNRHVFDPTIDCNEGRGRRIYFDSTHHDMDDSLQDIPLIFLDSLTFDQHDVYHKPLQQLYPPIDLTFPERPTSTFSQLTTWVDKNVDFRFSHDNDASLGHFHDDDSKPFSCEISFNERPIRRRVQSEYQKTFGVRLNDQQRHAWQNCSADTFAKICMPLLASCPSAQAEAILLQQYVLYQFPGFREYLATLPLYKPFILKLTAQMRANSKLRHWLDNLQGFTCKRGFLGIGRTKSEFRDWIYGQESAILREAEQKKIKQQKAQATHVKVDQQVKKLAQEADAISRAKQVWHAQEKRQHQPADHETLFNTQKLEELTDFFLACSEQQALTDPQTDLLISQGLACLEHAEADHVNNSSTWLKRAEAIASMLTNPVDIEQRYALHDQVIFLIDNSNDYLRCQGNLLQQELHDELVSTLNETASLHHAYKTDQYVDNVVQLTLATTQNARVCNQEKAYEQSMALADYASGLLAVGKQWADFARQGGWALYKIAEVTAEGLVQGGKQALTTCTHLLTNPTGVVRDLVSTIGKLGEFCLRAHMLVDGDKESFFVSPPDPKKVQAFCDHYGLTPENMQHALDQVYANPQLIYKNSVACVTEGMLVGKATSLACKGAGVACCAVTEKTIQTLRKAVTNESKLATLAEAALGPELAATEQVQTLLRPLQTGLQEGILTGAAEMVEAEVVNNVLIQLEESGTKNVSFQTNLKHMESLVGGAEVVDNLQHIKNLGLKDGMKLTSDEALSLARRYLGSNYYEVKPGSGRFVSQDGTRVVRMGINDITGSHGGGPHMNFEILVPHSLKQSKMQVSVNMHVYLMDQK